MYIGNFDASTLSNLTVPKSGLINPIMRLNIVLLPAPLGPSNPTISPELILKSMLSSICLLS